MVIWDEPKRLANLAKHGLDFADFDAGFSFDRFAALPSKPSATGRIRYRFVGLMKGSPVVAVVSPLGTEALSILSLRPANARERKPMTRSKAAPYKVNPHYSREDWETVSDNPPLTSDELASLKPASEVLPADLYDAITRKRGPGQRGPGKKPAKIAVTLRLDPDVIQGFKAGGPGWQSRINSTLRTALQSGKF